MKKYTFKFTSLYELFNSMLNQYKFKTISHGLFVHFIKIICLCRLNSYNTKTYTMLCSDHLHYGFNIRYCKTFLTLNLKKDKLLINNRQFKIKNKILKIKKFQKIKNLKCKKKK